MVMAAVRNKEPQNPVDSGERAVIPERKSTLNGGFQDHIR